jgi:hypothetical protein
MINKAVWGCVMLGLVFTDGMAQTTTLNVQSSPYSQPLEIKYSPEDQFCAYDGERIVGKLYGFLPDSMMEKLLAEVSAYGPAIKLRLFASNVSNAAALVTGDEKLLLFSQQFMDKLSEETDTWYSVKAILAHEVAHHIFGHTLSKSPDERHKEELAADRYSGMVLRQMGATLKEALSAVAQIGPQGDSPTHPGAEVRKAAVTSGYKRPDDLKLIKIGTNKGNLPEQSSFLSRLTLKDDPQGEYLVTHEQDVLKIAPDGKLLMMGQATKKTDGEYELEYDIAHTKYAVDSNGKIWKPFHGVPVIHGIVDSVAATKQLPIPAIGNILSR